MLLSLLVRHGQTAPLTSASLGDDGDLALLRDLFLRVSSQAWLVRTSPHERAGDNIHNSRILMFVPRR